MSRDQLKLVNGILLLNCCHLPSPASIHLNSCKLHGCYFGRRRQSEFSSCDSEQKENYLLTILSVKIFFFGDTSSDDDKTRRERERLQNK